MRYVRSMVVVLALLLAACAPTTPTTLTGGETTAPPVATTDVATTAPEATAATELVPVTLAMGYIPNVQFAPFYVALEKGYFADEGLDVTLDYGMENDLIELVASDQLQFAIASGDQVLLGRSGGRPIKYVANWYRRFPVAITSISEDLSDLNALEGKTVGLPGLYGANYIGWLGLAHAAGLNTDHITLEAIGFNQIPVLAEGQVDAAMVYAMNEPLQLEQEGYTVNTVLVADYIDLVANGLITNDKTIQENPKLVQRMVTAILRGIQDTLDDPDGAFTITRQDKYGTGITDDTAEAQRAVLNASLDFWRNDHLGLLPDSAWETSQQFMVEAGLLPKAVPLTDVYTNDFIP